MGIEDTEHKPQRSELKLDATAWNEWREQHAETAIDLFRLDVFRLGPFKARLFRTGIAIQWKIADVDRGDLVQDNFSEANLRDADLRGADLRRADLRCADLYLVNLRGTDLRGADLRDTAFFDADLRGADLRGTDLRSTALNRANLSGANLSGADLSGVTLSGIDLSGADLSGADLREATLYSVNLRSADLSGARILKTSFDDLDLRTVKGLETIKHEGPSIIAISTLSRSESNIPEVFLRRAGLSETLITRFCSPTQHPIQRPIQYYTCFISYSGKDRSFAERLTADLRRKGVQCWYAPEDLKIGDHYHQSIEEAILLHDKLIIILTEHAIQSPWVEREVEAACEKENDFDLKVLFPIRLDDAVMQTTKAWAANVRRRWHMGDFTRWKDRDAYQQAFERLLHDLKDEQKPKD